MTEARSTKRVAADNTRWDLGKSLQSRHGLEGAERSFHGLLGGGHVLPPVNQCPSFWASEVCKESPSSYGLLS